MLSDDEMRFALDDARARHKELVELIYFIDKQALRLLGFYLTLGVASASTAVAGLSQTTPIPLPASFALGGAAFALLVGGFLCFIAMESADVNLPGRDAEFWIWANRPDIPRELIFKAYLDNLKQKTNANRQVNQAGAQALMHAKLCGVLTPAIAMLAGGVALLLEFLLP
jgi:hypothetical protein